MVKIGIIKEGKIPEDNRVPLTPKQCAQLLKDYEGKIQIKVQSSNNRCFKDQDYIDHGIEVVNEVDDMDILLGVKEVPIEDLIENKTYFFFSHTIKMQPYNQDLMKALIAKKIRMIDYEPLTFENGKRIIGFGFYAGVVGAHNAILSYGKKHNLFHIKAAHNAYDYEEMIAEYEQVKLDNARIVMTGSGRVAEGFLAIMEVLKVKEVSPEEYLNNNFDYPVFTHLKHETLYQNINGAAYNRMEFYEHPERYKCLFSNYMDKTDILLNGIFWTEEIDALFTKEDAQKDSFKISVIADVTCDINGSVPINVGAATIADPVYGIRKNDLSKVAPFQNDKGIIDMMTVDNLPNELPRDASHHFGEALVEHIVPEFYKKQSDILDRATICNNGELTIYYDYLDEYAFGE